MTVTRWGTPDQVEAQKLRFYPGDVIFGRRRAYQKKVARADFEGICSAHALVLRAKTERMDCNFLPVFLSSDLFLQRAVQISVGSLSPTVNWKTLAVQEFQLPPLDEQLRIAEFLWSVEREKASSVKAHRAAEVFVSALVDYHFGATTGSSSLAEYCAPDGIRIGPFGTQLHAHEYLPTGVPVVMPQDMVDNRISTENIKRVSEQKALQLASHRLREGDILLPRRGELDRRALVTKSEQGWLCGTGSVRVRPREGVSSEALLLALSASATLSWLNSNATGTTMPNLNASIVSRIPLKIPEGDEATRLLGRLDIAQSAVDAFRARAESARSLQSQLLATLFGQEGTDGLQ